MFAFSATITGRVQGVGFRWRAMSTAGALRLTGWARNNDDGSVDVWAEGEKNSLEQFRDWLTRGPPYARVDSVAWDWCEPTGKYKDFGVRY
jgi:acylphosphatase